MKTSPLFRLDLRDAAKGLIVAVGGAVITLIENSISAGTFQLDWKKIGMAALAAGLAYLVKNFFTPSQVVTPAPSPAPTPTPTPALAPTPEPAPDPVATT